MLHITWSNADTVESPAGAGTRRAAGVTHTYSAMVTSVDLPSSRSPMYTTVIGCRETFAGILRVQLIVESQSALAVLNCCSCVSTQRAFFESSRCWFREYYIENAQSRAKVNRRCPSNWPGTPLHVDSSQHHPTGAGFAEYWPAYYTQLEPPPRHCAPPCNRHFEDSRC